MVRRVSGGVCLWRGGGSYLTICYSTGVSCVGTVFDNSSPCVCFCYCMLLHTFALPFSFLACVAGCRLLVVVVVVVGGGHLSSGRSQGGGGPSISEGEATGGDAGMGQGAGHQKGQSLAQQKTCKKSVVVSAVEWYTKEKERRSELFFFFCDLTVFAVVCVCVSSVWLLS